MILADVEDRGVEESVRKVVDLWGGPFFVQSGEPWEAAVKRWHSLDGLVIHLSMYGQPLEDVLWKVRDWKVRDRDLLVVMGAEKVPGELFEAADLNVAVGHQPHSEVAALAVFLDRIFGGAELKKEFKNGKLRIIPSLKGKKVEKIR